MSHNSHITCANACRYLLPIPTPNAKEEPVPFVCTLWAGFGLIWLGGCECSLCLFRRLWFAIWEESAAGHQLTVRWNSNFEQQPQAAAAGVGDCFVFVIGTYRRRQWIRTNCWHYCTHENMILVVPRVRYCHPAIPNDWGCSPLHVWSCWW